MGVVGEDWLVEGFGPTELDDAARIAERLGITREEAEAALVRLADPRHREVVRARTRRKE